MRIRKDYILIICLVLVMVISETSMSAIATVENNVVSNANFDQGKENWGLVTKSGASAVFDVTNAEARITINNASTNWANLLLRQHLPVQRGKTYEISFTARANIPKQITVFIQDSMSPYKVIVKQSVNLSESSTFFGTFNFTSTNTYAQSYLMFGIGKHEQETSVDNAVVYIDNIKVNEISPPVFDNLEVYKNVHPRLYTNPQQVNQLRQAVLPGGSHALLFGELTSQANYILQSSPPVYVYQENMNWQREVGNKMATLATAYMLSLDNKYLVGAKQWALASCSYPLWGTSSLNNVDLAAAHQLFGLAIVYDYCYDGLDEATRQTIRNTIITRGNDMYSAANKGYAWYWNNTWLQNHIWVNVTGLTAAGLAIYDEATDADITRWFERSSYMMNKSMSYLGSDGASQEGYAYAEYGISNMLKYMDLSRKFFNVDFYQTPFVENLSDYFLYLSLPKNSWKSANRVVNIGDSPRYDWYGPDYTLRKLAREYSDSNAQWLASEIDKANLEDPGARWLNLFWYDKDINETTPNTPLIHYFDNMEIVSARSSWAGDESLLVFKCGPYIGHNAVSMNNSNPFVDWGGGHAHPDAGHFVLSGNGDWLLRDDGYSNKRTGQHNTLLIDGKGQLGEELIGKWFNSQAAQKAAAFPTIDKVVSMEMLDYVVGDATSSYPADLGLTKFKRYMLFMKPDVLIVADEIKLQQPQPLELRFFPEEQTYSSISNGFSNIGENSKLNFQCLTPKGNNVSAETLMIENIDNNITNSQLYYSIKDSSNDWKNAVAISWSDKAETPKNVDFVEKNSEFRFIKENTTAILNFSPPINEDLSVSLAVFNRDIVEETIEAEVEITNCNSDLRSAIVIMAVYDNEELVGVKAINKNINGKSTDVAKEFISLPNDRNYQVNLMIWTDFDILRPVYFTAFKPAE